MMFIFIERLSLNLHKFKYIGAIHNWGAKNECLMEMN